MKTALPMTYRLLLTNMDTNVDGDLDWWRLMLEYGWQDAETLWFERIGVNEPIWCFDRNGEIDVQRRKDECWYTHRKLYSRSYIKLLNQWVKMMIQWISFGSMSYECLKATEDHEIGLTRINDRLYDGWWSFMRWRIAMEKVGQAGVSKAMYAEVYW